LISVAQTNGLAGRVRHLSAAAIEQLKLWGERLKRARLAGAYGADPASVAHDAVTSALARNRLRVVDTAAGSHNQTHLMQELQIAPRPDKSCRARRMSVARAGWLDRQERPEPGARIQQAVKVTRTGHSPNSTARARAACRCHSKRNRLPIKFVGGRRASPMICSPSTRNSCRGIV